MSLIRSAYEKLIGVGESLQSTLLLAIRLYWGYNFFQGGLGKLRNIENIVPFFQELGIPFPELNAYLVGTIECFGGLFLLFGFATRLAAIPLIIVMVVAYLTADIEAVKNILQEPDVFLKKDPFNFLFASLLLFVFGPGKVSVDYLIERIIGKKEDRSQKTEERS